MIKTKIFAIGKMKGLKIGSSVIHTHGFERDGYQFVKAVIDQSTARISIYKSKDKITWQFVRELSDQEIRG